MPDPYKNLGMSLSSPAVEAADVTPSDTQDLPVTTRALWVGGAGDVAVRMAGGTDNVFVNVSGLLPIRVDRVRATGTTAASIVAVW